MIRTTNVRHGRVNLNGVRYVDEHVYRRWVRRGEPLEGDIVLTREAPLGEVGMLRESRGVFLGQRLVMYRPNPDRVDRNFLLHAMRSPDVQAQIRAFGSGATVEHMRVPDCGELRIACPGLAEQRRIGAVLAVFDELIEINERRMELLEDLARSLYREWFVRFRFPGHNGDSNGVLPDGWKLRPASEILHINPKIRPNQLSLSKVTMGDVDERVSVVFPSEIVTRASGSKFQRDDVLFARITPCLENGKTALVKFLEAGDVAVGSTEFIVLRGASVGPAFTYCAARSHALREHAIKSMSGASGRQRVATDSFDSIHLTAPAPTIADAFERAAGPMLDEVFALASVNRQLSTTRDLLFPRLVTGRLDISDVDLGDLLAPEGE
jgi:type I restriction enzyme S subunit